MSTTKLKKSIQTQLYCCDDRIASELRSKANHRDPRVQFEMGMLCGLIMAANFAGIPSDELEFIRWDIQTIRAYQGV